MPAPNPFVLIAPSTRGLSLALTRHFLRTSDLPVCATYRKGSAEEIKQNIISPFRDDGVNPKRLTLLPLDLLEEDSIASAARILQDNLPKDHESYIDTAFFTGGMLHPEKSPQDIDSSTVLDTFRLNVISHLLLMKHFSRFLPSSKYASSTSRKPLSKWVHISARVSSLGDNNTGGWYSYRASKCGLNQAIKTFDLHLQQKRIPAIAVGIHPGTVKTDLSKDFWKEEWNDGHGEKQGRFEPDEAAKRIAAVVARLGQDGRGRVWDWKGEAVPY